ncbi:cadherin domain-containing protein, partial [Cylindrospermopsis raciborskii]|uniref:cadherin domain-containing protein n=1 Tax=Cylindrospermopsis raciborskii TaxID=77022 RepID=UPI0038D07F32
DQSLFTINANTGALSFKTPPDFEAPTDAGTNNIYNLQIGVTDGKNPVNQDLIINVTNINETPTITSPATANFAENGTGTAYTVTATDPDAGTTFTYSLSGTDAALFNINSTGAVTFKTPPNFEAPSDAGANNIYDLTVSASDGSLSASQAVAITVTNVNEAPTITSSATANFAENGTGTAYTILATDPDTGTTLTYSLSGTDAALFNISSTTGVVTFNTAPDFEAPGDNVYDLTVSASDGSLTASQAVAITVTNVNETPTFNPPTATFFKPENSTTVEIITATDPDAGDTLTYTLSGADASKFNIDPSTRLLSFKTPPDFEAPGSAVGTNAYSVTVTATDSGGLITTQAVTINVTNVDEIGNPPVIASSSNFPVAENSTTVGTIAATDADGDSLTYSISGGADQSLFTINANTGALSFKTPPDFEAPTDAGTNNIYNLQIRVTDGKNPVNQDLIINVTNINEPPVFSSPFSFTVRENSKSVGKIDVEDPEGDAITFALAGVDAKLLSIDSQGNLTFNQEPDYEKPEDEDKNNIYQVQVTVKAGTDTVTQDIPITVENVNEAPIAIGDFLAIIGNNSGSIEPLKNDSDPDSGDKLKIIGATDGKQGKVEIIDDQLKYTLSNAAYTGDDVFSYTISDQGNLTATANVRVNVTGTKVVVNSGVITDVKPGDPLIPAEAGSPSDIVNNVSFTFSAGYSQPQAEQTLRNVLGRTDAAFTNLFGLYEIDNATGTVNGIAPGQTGYAKAALNRAVSSFTVRAGGSGNGITGNVIVGGDKLYAPFVIANGGNLSGSMQDAINQFFQANAINSPATAQNYTTFPVAYFSFGAANPDGAAHIKSFGNNIFGFEDLPAGVGVNDYDFNDMVFSFG